MVFIVSVALYANTLGHEFVWDDHGLIAENPVVRTLDAATVAKIFTQNFWGGVHVEGSYYRPVVALSYHVDYALYSGDPRGFHATNVLLNALACVLAFGFVYLLFGNSVFATATALIFAVHPVHTEAVAWISGRTDVMATLWILATLCSYVLWRRQKGVLFIAASLGAFMLALWSKETALCVPLLIVLLEIGPFDALHSPRRPVRQIVIAAALYVVTLCLYLLLRYNAVGETGSHYPGFAPGLLGKVALPLSIFAGYVYKVLLPVTLSGEYDAAIPASLAAPPVILGAVAVTALLWAVWRFRRHPEVVVGAGIFVFGLAPVMNLVPIGEISAERFLYFPSLGVALVTGWFFATALQARFVSLKSSGASRGTGASATLAVVAVLLPLLALRTMVRNADWKSDETLFAKNVAQEPDNPRAHAAVADAAMRRGDVAAAIRGYRKAIELNPDYTIALSSLAGIYARQGRFDDALPLVQHALAVSPQDPQLINNLGSLYFESGQADKAAEQFEKALQINPDELKAHFNLGLIRLRQKDAAAARQHFARAVQGGESYRMANFYLAVIDNAAGRSEDAIRWARAFLAVYERDDVYRRQAQAIAGGAE